MVRFNKAIENDPIKDLLTFMKEENERSGEHEKTLLQMQMQMNMQMCQMLAQSSSQPATATLIIFHRYQI